MDQKPIQAVIFDFGGVILRTQDWSGRRKWEQRLGLAANEAEAIVFNSEEGRQAQLGRVSYDAHWTWLGQRFQLPDADLKAFEADFWAGDVLDTEMVALIRRLRPLVKTGLISNAFSDLRQVLTHQFEIADAFDTIVISAEEGIMKPDPRLYQIALDRLDCRPEEALFIDDFTHNVAGAQAVGMHGLQFTPSLNLADALRGYGLAI